MSKQEKLKDNLGGPQETGKQAAESAQWKAMAEALESIPQKEPHEEGVNLEKLPEGFSKENIKKISDKEYFTSYVPGLKYDTMVRNAIEAAKQLDGSLTFEFNGKKGYGKGRFKLDYYSERLKAAINGDLPADEIRPTNRPVGDDFSQSEIETIEKNYKNRKNR